MRKSIFLAFTLAFVLATSTAAFAKDNSLTLYGSMQPTFLGLEYERRIGDWGVGAEFGLLPLNEYTQRYHLSPFGRYYFNVDFPVKPFLTLYPGMVFALYSGPVAMPEADWSTDVDFCLLATAGAEYKLNWFRAALEVGGGFAVVPSPTAAVIGLFTVKGGVGVAF